MQKIVNGNLVDLSEDEEFEFLQRQQEWNANKKPRTIQQVKDAMEAHIEATAKSLGYKSAADLISWQNSVISDKVDDADLFITWRDTIFVETMNAIDSYDKGKSDINLNTFTDSLTKIKMEDK